MRIARTANEQCLGYSKKDHRRCRLQRRPGEKTCLIHKHYYTNWFETHTVNEWRMAGKRCRSEMLFQLSKFHVVPTLHTIVRIETHSLDFWNLCVKFSDEPIRLNEGCFHFSIRNIVRSLLIMKHTGSDEYRDYIQNVRNTLDTYLKTPADCKAVFLKILDVLVSYWLLVLGADELPTEKIRRVFQILLLKPRGWRQIVFSEEMKTLHRVDLSSWIVSGPSRWLDKLDVIISQVLDEMQTKHKHSIQERTHVFKEELIQEVLHPRRIEPLIYQYGIEILDQL
jgi:hypothetical protein